MAKKTFLIAEGDSWFALPDVFFFYPCDIINQLESFGYEIESVAGRGQRLQDMVKHTGPIKNKIKKNKKPKAILFSGGGNDVLGRLPQMLNEGGYGKPVINIHKAKQVVTCIEEQYEQWLCSVTKICKKHHRTKIPILIHGYGYVVPNNQQTFYPWVWLYPHFRRKKQMNLQANTTALAVLMDLFNKMLSNLPKKGKLNHVKYIDVRDCLSNSLVCRDNPEENYTETNLCNAEFQMDWNDEIHPTSDGFLKIAKKFRKEIERLP